MVIGILGYGDIGCGVCEMLSVRPEFRVKAICCEGHPARVQAAITGDYRDLAGDPEIGTVVELSQEAEPALEQVRACIEAGKHVVTANRPLMAAHWAELLNLAADRGVSLRCTAALGGVGWLSALEWCRRADTIHEVTGILNGTTNYILDTMHLSPVSFQAALGRAQDFGYTERDPALDLDGIDSLRRLVLTANAAFNTCLTPDQVLVRGIRGIQRRDVETVTAHGCCCRLLASAEHYTDTFTAVVEPTLVEQKDLEAAIHSNYNLLTFVSRQAGKQSVCSQGAGRYTTAYNVVQDLLAAAGGRAVPAVRPAPGPRVDNHAFVRRYYVRTAVSEPWLWSRTEERWETGVITCRLPAPDMHAWAEEARRKDPELFFAALR